MKKGFQAIATVLTLLVVVPIWYYILYQVLVRVQASELMWFLFWVYVPANFLAALILKLTAKE